VSSCARIGVRWARTRRVLGGAGLSALLLAGCGLGAGRTPGAVQLLVTEGFGGRVLHSARAPRERGQETVMSLLMRNDTVGTRYGGGFVQSIDGRSGGTRGGDPIDWFYYVNGVEAPMGAAATNVHQGDRIWWDLHDWSQTEDVPAIVGSFPEPFLHGIEGRRLPVRVECAEPKGAACGTVSAWLRAAGVAAASTAGVAGAGATHTLRVLVGPFVTIDADPSAQSIAKGPRASGIYARFSTDGHTLSLLDASGRVRRDLGAGAGLIAATRTGEDAPVWLVTGTDASGVSLAAQSLREASLRDRFALALAGPGSSVALPAGER
jgi:Domain of unknown function (DUF4430)